jgi:hypothetical protein
MHAFAGRDAQLYRAFHRQCAVSLKLCVGGTVLAHLVVRHKKQPREESMAAMPHTTTRWTTSLLATSMLLLGASASAQTALPSQPDNAQDAKRHLTAARDALSEMTQLPAASQLTGLARTRVQELIANFNELITKTTDWRPSYEKVEASLANLLEVEEPAPDAGAPTPTGAAATAGGEAVGTSGTTQAIDPGIRAKLVEFGTHLVQYESVAAGASPDAGAPPTEPTVPAGPPATPDRDATPDAPAPPVEQDASAATGELLRHVEAIEVILGAQAAAQAAATSAAGGAVTSTPTPSGSTKTTIAGPGVTLNSAQIAQIKTHLAGMRRLLEKK